MGTKPRVCPSCEARYPTSDESDNIDQAKNQLAKVAKRTSQGVELATLDGMTFSRRQKDPKIFRVKRSRRTNRPEGRRQVKAWMHDVPMVLTGSVRVSSCCAGIADERDD